MKTSFPLKGLVIIVSALLITACTQLPTEKQGISDIRPKLSFKISAENMKDAHVFIDGLDMGPVTDYQEGSAELRVLSGPHSIRIDLGGKTVTEEKIYMGDGVNRTILVK